MARVTCRGLWKKFGDHVVLENINLEVGDHELVTIVGASGCGKTTFLRMLLGVEAPSRGRLLIDGDPVPAEPGPDRGIVFQRYSLFPHLTVVENLMLGLELQGSRVLGRLFGARRRAAQRKAERWLEAVGLGAARNKYPPQLSGGMQQRLSIAQSVICEPRILLLDEPFGALDPGITADMHKLIVDLWAANRMTIFMITHDLKESFQLGTRLLVFDKVRQDPHAPEAYGARITFDIPLRGPELSRVNTPASVLSQSPSGGPISDDCPSFRASTGGAPSAPRS
jgi:NitT/TauT family transport system ATP-binding protein